MKLLPGYGPSSRVHSPIMGNPNWPTNYKGDFQHHVVMWLKEAIDSQIYRCAPWESFKDQLATAMRKAAGEI